MSWGITLSPISLLGVHFDVIVVRSLQLAARLNPSVIAPMLVDVDDTPTVDYELAYPSHRIRHNTEDLFLSALYHLFEVFQVVPFH